MSAEVPPISPEIPTYQAACDYIAQVSFHARVNLLQGLLKLPTDDFQSPLARLLNEAIAKIKEIESIAKDGDLSDEIAKMREKLRHPIRQ